jgi:ubiquinone/menaquinone biosynthesis C-methylase UbiE
MRPAQYALGHSEGELERLSRQARAYEPFTRYLFQETGIRTGMRVLDVGSGSGDVAFLAAELAGASGEVVGTDLAAAAVERANGRARSRGARNVKFVEGDPAEMEFEQAFDAIVGRLVLMYSPDPEGTLRKLARHLRPGGLMVFQEIDISNCRSLPNAPIFERATGWITRTFHATGARTQMGLELYSIFVKAGLPGPSMRMDAAIGGGQECAVYALVADVVQSLLPEMDKLKIATAAEVEISSLTERMRQEVVAAKAVVTGPALIGAWSRKSAPFSNSRGRNRNEV